MDANEVKNIAEQAMDKAYQFISRGHFKGQDPVDVAEDFFWDFLEASNIPHKSAEDQLRAYILFRTFAEEYEPE